MTSRQTGWAWLDQHPPVVAESNMILDCAGKCLDLSRPCVMGILNVTPDSFSDGGRFATLMTPCDRPSAWSTQASTSSTLVANPPARGVGHIGRRGTDPRGAGHRAPSPAVRYATVHRYLKPEVMRAAVTAGAGMINDVCVLGAPGAIAAAAELAVPVCLMHMQGEPRTMQTAPQYDDVVADIIHYLAGRVDSCVAAGIDRTRLLVDPGFGFGSPCSTT